MVCTKAYKAYSGMYQHIMCVVVCTKACEHDAVLCTSTYDVYWCVRRHKMCVPRNVNCVAEYTKTYKVCSDAYQDTQHKVCSAMYQGL